MIHWRCMGDSEIANTMPVFFFWNCTPTYSKLFLHAMNGVYDATPSGFVPRINLKYIWNWYFIHFPDTENLPTVILTGRNWDTKCQILDGLTQLGKHGCNKSGSQRSKFGGEVFLTLHVKIKFSLNRPHWAINPVSLDKKVTHVTYHMSRVSGYNLEKIWNGIWRQL